MRTIALFAGFGLILVSGALQTFGNLPNDSFSLSCGITAFLLIAVSVALYAITYGNPTIRPR